MKENSLEVTKYIQIAEINYRQGNIYQANEIYKKLINQKIYTYDLLISYGLFNKDINNLKTAKNLFFLSIKKYPLKINSYILLAEILRKENNIEIVDELNFKGPNSLIMFIVAPVLIFPIFLRRVLYKTYSWN